MRPVLDTAEQPKSTLLAGFWRRRRARAQRNVASLESAADVGMARIAGGAVAGLLVHLRGRQEVALGGTVCRVQVEQSRLGAPELREGRQSTIITEVQLSSDLRARGR
jgi:hypothetical protein